MSSLLIANLILGPTMLLLALVFKLYPPRKRNPFYGFRTPRSNRSQESWDEGNRFAANVILIVSILTCFLQASLYAVVEVNLAFKISAGFLVVGLLTSIIVTEMHLKKRGF